MIDREQGDAGPVREIGGRDEAAAADADQEIGRPIVRLERPRDRFDVGEEAIVGNGGENGFRHDPDAAGDGRSIRRPAPATIGKGRRRELLTARARVPEAARRFPSALRLPPAWTGGQARSQLHLRQCPGMAPFPLRDRGQRRRIAEGDAEPAAAAQEGEIGAEPARRAGAGQRAVGDDDVRRRRRRGPSPPSGRDWASGWRGCASGGRRGRSRRRTYPGCRRRWAAISRSRKSGSAPLASAKVSRT